MLIVVDQQEQAPWHFNTTVHRTVRRHLETGDYSINGFENVVAVERKSLNDLVHTVIHDWRRFTRELRRMASMDIAWIVVEAPVSSLTKGLYDSKALPQSVRGKLNSILIDYGIPTMFLDDRETAADWVLNVFELFMERRNAI